MIKVVHILFNLRLGGTETMLLDIMSHQIEQGAEVTFVLINREHDAALLEKIPKGIKVVNINRTEGSKNPWYVWKLNRALSRIKPAIVHVHNDKTMSLIIKRKGVRYVGTIHSVGLNIPNIKKWDRIFAISHAVKDDIMKRYGLSSKVIHNGVPLRNISSSKTEKKDNCFRIVQLGRLYCDTKAPDLTIEAVDLLSKRRDIDDLVVDFIGDGPAKNLLQDLVEKKSLHKNFRFLGRLSRSEIYVKLSEYDLLVQPSRSEGFGLAIAEAMVAKVPVLVSDIPGPMEVIGNGEFGEYFQSENVEAYANKLDEILNDYDKYKRLALIKAYEYVNNSFDIRLTSQRYINEYLSLM